jgi:hypothetical protein
MGEWCGGGDSRAHCKPLPSLLFPITQYPTNSTPSPPVFFSPSSSCSQLYYELAAERAKQGKQGEVALIRVEQMAPFPFDLVMRELRRFPNAGEEKGRLLDSPALACLLCLHVYRSLCSPAHPCAHPSPFSLPFLSLLPAPLSATFVCGAEVMWTQVRKATRRPVQAALYASLPCLLLLRPRSPSCRCP